jgi:predicted DNA binding CopG/RHH family protein
MNTNEENEIIHSVENGEWSSVSDLERMKERLVAAASETALKDYRINVRISKRDVEALKTRALEEGIPYQTLVTSILHKYVTGRMVEKKEKVSPGATLRL